MKDVEVLVSPDTDMATAKLLGIANLSLAQGGEAAQVFEVIGTNVRLVKLHGLSNWGQGYTVGLAEVRFESDVISGNMPSVTVSTPHEGDVIPFGTDIQVNALISDKEGNSNLQKVQLYDGTRLLLEKTTSTPPWQAITGTPSPPSTAAPNTR